MKPNREPEPQGLINGSDEIETILSENALHNLSKSLTGIISSNGDGLEDGAFARTHSLLQNLLRTASSSKISLKHGAAALNTLSWFLDQCSTSPEARTRDLVYNRDTWTRAFNIYLTRSNNNKPKPLRRLLLTMTRILSRHDEDHEKALLVGIPTCTATRAIRKQDDSADIKPAIQVLEHFLSVDLLSALEIAQIKRPEDLGRSPEKSTTKYLENSDYQLEQVEQSVQNFAISVLEWMQYPDCAPAVGRLLHIFFTSVGESHSNGLVQLSKDGAIPLWIVPLEQTLERHQELWEVFEIHILPSLLRLGPIDIEAFIRTLPIDSIQRDNICSSSVLKIRLCVLVVKVVAEDSSLRKHFCQGQNTLPDADNFGISLLEHPSSSVRIAALSLLVSPSASTKPFCLQVFQCLRRCIPYFHVEANARPRNEFIALMKRLWMRIQGATIPLLKRGKIPGESLRGQGSIATEIIARYDGDGSMGSRSVNVQTIDEEPQVLEKHLAFQKWYMVFLFQELRPTASYQSHITALKLLEFLLEQTIALRNRSSRSCNDYVDALNNSLPRGVLIGPLAELLLDPFDDVRESANRVIDLHLSTISIQESRESMNLKAGSFDQKAEYQTGFDDHRRAVHSILFDLNNAEIRVGITGRADHADGLGRLYSLLFTTSSTVERPDYWYQSRYSILNHVISALEKEVNVAKDDILRAVSNVPLHGHLIALRYMVSRTDYFELLDTSLDRWDEFDRRMFSICSGIWEVVHDILCSDAPEGHDFSEDEFSEQEIGSKDALSFCWRALKESSLLMHAIVTNIGYIAPSLRSNSQYEGYHTAGHQAFTQLAELRHRGAFSTVSHTFAACCIKCARSSQPVFQEYPKHWYKLALESIMSNASSLTRRSAGIPAIVVGVLAAFPGDKFFDHVVLDLQAMANAPVGADSGALPQVHALNCLKDIFTDARFGLSTETYVANALETAASCLECPIWNIRNCGLMLFKALLKRLNGGTDTSSTKASSSHRRFSLLTYEKYPNLPDLLLRLLRQDPSKVQATGGVLEPTVQAHRVFPALEVIERFGIPSQHQGSILDALRSYNESPIWSLREKTAKAMSLIIDGPRFVEEVANLLAPNWKTQNTLHGRLLRLRFLLTRSEAPLFGELLTTYETIASLVEDSFEIFATRNTCPITTATFLDVVVDLFATLIMSNSEKSSSFLVLVLALCQEDVKEKPALALLKSPLRRCKNLANYVQALKNRPQRNGSTETLRRLSKEDIDAIQVVNLALQNSSDENDLAILRLCTARELRWASDITQCPDALFVTDSSNHRQFDYMLALHGYALGERYASDSSNADIQAWIHLLSEAGTEHSDLRTRRAAVFSIRAFFDGIHDHGYQPTSDPQFLGIYLALYGILVDDDEDVRDQGARVVSTILSVATASAADKGNITLLLSPPAAKERLLEFLCEGYRTSTLLCVEGVRRLTGSDPVQDLASAKTHDNNSQTEKAQSLLRLRSLADQSIEARTTSNVVFVEERQNLYLDSVREAESWTDLLTRLNRNAWPLNLLSELQNWTVDGLEHILNTLHQNSTDEAPPSPTSKAEVFTLYTRVILSAKVLTMHRGSRDEEGGKEHACVVGLLEKVLVSGRSIRVHELLLERVESVLAEIGLVGINQE